jgi:hypothetical protein
LPSGENFTTNAAPVLLLLSGSVAMLVDTLDVFTAYMVGVPL